MCAKVCAKCCRAIFVVLLLLFGVALTCPYEFGVYADSDISDTSALPYNYARPTVSIALGKTIDLEINPASVEGATYATTNINISTSRSTGFRVLLNSDSDTLRRQSHQDESGLKSITEPTVLSTFPTNSWGIYFGDTDPTTLSSFLPVTTDIAEIAHKEDSNASGTYTLAIAAKADTTLPVGYYVSNLVISVVADPAKVFDGITYMQEMTPEICANAEESDTAQLVDRRDNKKYWIAKLKDGRCWMTQNLALDLSTSTTLTADDSNITNGVNFTPTSNTNSVPLNGSNISTAVTNQWSWDFGSVVLAMPAYNKNCNSTAIASDTENYAAQIARQCGSAGVVDVSDASKFTPNYQATASGSWVLPDGTEVSNTLVTIKCTEWSDTSNGKICTAGAYDAHYLFGNLYSWYAASAGTARTTSYSADVPNSVCPRGWRLAGAKVNSFATGTWANMLKQYGFVTNAAVNSSSGNKVTATVNGVTYNIFGTPVYMSLPGVVSATNKATLSGITSNSVIWSSTNGSFVDQPGVSDIATTPSFSATTITPSAAPSSRGIGYSVRCINQN